MRKTSAGDAMRAEIMKAVARVCIVLFAHSPVLQLHAEQDMSGLLGASLGQVTVYRGASLSSAMQESESKTKRERLSSSRNLNAHIADGPLSSLDLEGAAPHPPLHIWLLLNAADHLRRPVCSWPCKVFCQYTSAGSPSDAFATSCVTTTSASNMPALSKTETFTMVLYMHAVWLPAHQVALSSQVHLGLIRHRYGKAGASRTSQMRRCRRRSSATCMTSWKLTSFTDSRQAPPFQSDFVLT